MLNAKTPLRNIPKINSKYFKVLEKRGLTTIEDLLFYFPYRYDDFSKIVPLTQIPLGEIVTVQGKIKKSKTVRIWKRKMSITEIIISDESGDMKAVWFNQPYLETTLQEGKDIRIGGKVTQDPKKGTYFSNPSWELASRIPTNTGRLVPIYPETAGLTSKWIRWQIQAIFKTKFFLEDPIPEDILQEFKLPDLEKSLKYIHFPENNNQYLLAQKRFAFQEMFLVQLKSSQVRKDWEKNNSFKIEFNEKLIKDFVGSLPFKLTDCQRKSAFEILKDLEKPQPMNRLLNGDVGSGKTIVSAIAVFQTVMAKEKKYQVAIMAPTEVLAKQHFEKFSKIFENYNFTIALLTNSYKLIRSCHSELAEESTQRSSRRFAPQDDKVEREIIIEGIKKGKINLVIGTHAIIQKDVRFKNLALVIIDEQHRFGVAQRSALQQETMQISDESSATIPHLLTMTATPIPRTLAIAIFGSLDLSILDELPKGRKKIITRVVLQKERKEAYSFIRSQIEKGRQAYVIFPLVEESKALSEIKAAVKEHKKLSEEIFPDLKVGLLHGKLKAQEKEEVMQEFSDGKIDILAATSVIEVGIDVPNATVMMIEDAERFGLTQLHQFRGRVGRGEHQSYCFLFTSSTAEKSSKRLEVMENTNDGFEISQKDLELRGPGQFFGLIQSGIPDIAMENFANIKLVKLARTKAQEIINIDPDLSKHPLLKNALQKFKEKIHLE